MGVRPPCDPVVRARPVVLRQHCNARLTMICGAGGISINRFGQSLRTRRNSHDSRTSDAGRMGRRPRRIIAKSPPPGGRQHAPPRQAEGSERRGVRAQVDPPTPPLTRLRRIDSRCCYRRSRRRLPHPSTRADRGGAPAGVRAVQQLPRPRILAFPFPRRPAHRRALRSSGLAGPSGAERLRREPRDASTPRSSGRLCDPSRAARELRRGSARARGRGRLIGRAPRRRTYEINGRRRCRDGTWPRSCVHRRPARRAADHPVRDTWRAQRARWRLLAEAIGGCTWRSTRAPAKVSNDVKTLTAARDLVEEACAARWRKGTTVATRREPWELEARICIGDRPRPHRADIAVSCGRRRRVFFRGANRSARAAPPRSPGPTGRTGPGPLPARSSVPAGAAESDAAMVEAPRRSSGRRRCGAVPVIR